MNKLKSIIILHLSLLIYSLSLIASKYCSMEVFLSFRYIVFFGLQIVCLGIYALVWQIVLKKIPLSVAYANKGITIIWSMLIGYFLFKENISMFNIVGVLFIIVGIMFVVIKGENNE